MRLSGIYSGSSGPVPEDQVQSLPEKVRLHRKHGPSLPDRATGLPVGWGALDRVGFWGRLGSSHANNRGEPGESFVLEDFIHLSFAGFPQEMRQLTHFQSESVV